MNVSDAQLVVIGLVYCRVGPCLLLLPGLGHQQISKRIRGLLGVFIAIAVWGALPDDVFRSQDRPVFEIATNAVSEICTGLLLGLIGRCLMGAIEAFGAAISASIGLTANLGVPLELEPHAPAIGALCSLMASMAVFASDMHLEMILGLVESYSLIDPRKSFSAKGALEFFVDTLSDGFSMCFAIAAPFISFSIAVNTILAILGRISPQLQIFFLGGPILIGGGLLAFHGIGAPMMGHFLSVILIAVPGR